MKGKKGIQLNQAFGAVLTLVLVATLIIIAIVIFVNLSTSFAGTSTVSVVNESEFNATGGTQVANATACQFAGFTVNEINNGTETIPVLNYTTSADGTITNVSTDFGDTLWNVSYGYTWGSDACTASDNMTTEFGNYTSLIGLVGTIIFLGLVIGVLVASFVFGGRRDV